MRELALLGSLALAVMTGIGLGFAFALPTRTPVATAAEAIAPESSAATGTTVTRIIPPNSGNMDSYSATTYQWPGKDKEAVIGLVQKLSKSDADYLCLVLGLIPRDEVFDQVNVKGRLTRYIDGLSGPADLRDFEAAFKQLPTR